MSNLKIEQYERIPFEVDVVQVTDENIQQVAEWCQGDIRSGKSDDSTTRPYVKVRVQRPLTPRQTQAFVGDFVLYAGSGYKVYTENAFRKSFQPVHSEKRVVHRDSVTGGFVTEAYAAANPDTTIAQRQS